ncbi:hypothetical protein [Pediococcus acidilactici]|nr:hypothetical protein [Pediococcus acidilactici]
MTFDNETLAIFNYADQKAYKMACQINSLNLMNDIGAINIQRLLIIFS